MAQPSSTTVPTRLTRSGRTCILLSWRRSSRPRPGRVSCSATTSTPTVRVDRPLTEDLPNLATGPNGRTRARIAEALMGAHEAGRIQATIGRGSDFFGPHAHQSTVGDRVFARSIADKPAQVLGNPDVPHTVTYIEDFARALVTLGEREEAMGECGTSPMRRRSPRADSSRWSSSRRGGLLAFGRRPGGGSRWQPCSIQRCGRSGSSYISQSDPG
jgi:NAD dependent epimerase/dehydratase family